MLEHHHATARAIDGRLSGLNWQSEIILDEAATAREATLPGACSDPENRLENGLTAPAFGKYPTAHNGKTRSSHQHQARRIRGLR